jgi:hypothetical protein
VQAAIEKYQNELEVSLAVALIENTKPSLTNHLHLCRKIVRDPICTSLVMVLLRHLMQPSHLGSQLSWRVGNSYLKRLLQIFYRWSRRG